MISKHKSNIFCIHSLKVQMRNLLFYIFCTIKVIVGFKTLPASLILIWYLICFCQIATRWWQETKKPTTNPFFFSYNNVLLCVRFHELPPRFMRPPLFSGQRWSWRLGPGLEGLAGALLVSKKNKQKTKTKSDNTAIRTGDQRREFITEP